MTIFDLNWHPSLTEPGFWACTRFEDGITAHLSCKDGESYDLIIDGRGMGRVSHRGLSGTNASRLLRTYAAAHVL